KKHIQYSDSNFHFKDFASLFDALVVEKNNKGRIKNWKKTVVRERLFEEMDSALTYDENAWLKEAFANFEEKKFNQRKVKGAVLASNFSGSNWYKYYLTVKWYKKRFFHYCSKEGLVIPQ
ncbi:MAG: hypothetical protein KAW82_05270, partial [Desulfurellaceae bacterium]|nr:hypothetical protein [Desulfurellaceae bacterium]